jgi:hypothetical protein
MPMVLSQWFAQKLGETQPNFKGFSLKVDKLLRIAQWIKRRLETSNETPHW